MSARSDPAARAEVDAAAGLVRLGTAAWPFALDVRSGSATLALAGGRLTVAPLRWREKVVLARFTHLGADFVEEQLLRLAAGGAPPDDQGEAAVLLALANWLAAPGGGDGVPLETRLLTAVTLEVCRAIGLTPADLDGRDAAEVEALWRAAADVRPAPARGEAFPVPAAVAPPGDWEGPLTRIVVVPDPEAAPSRVGLDEEAESAAGGPAPEARGTVDAHAPAPAPSLPDPGVAAPASPLTAAPLRVGGRAPAVARYHAAPAPAGLYPNGMAPALGLPGPASAAGAAEAAPAAAPAPPPSSARSARPTPTASSEQRTPRSAALWPPPATTAPASAAPAPPGALAPPYPFAPARPSAPPVAADADALLAEFGERLERAAAELGIGVEA